VPGSDAEVMVGITLTHFFTRDLTVRAREQASSRAGPKIEEVPRRDLLGKKEVASIVHSYPMVTRIEKILNVELG